MKCDRIASTLSNFCRHWSAIAGTLLLAVVVVSSLAACGGASPAPTDVPTTPTSSDLGDASTSEPGSQKTAQPEPAVPTVAGFVQECESVTESLAMGSQGGSLAFDGTQGDITWGDLANIYDDAVGTYGRLNPPPELQTYHNAWLQTAEAIRSHARARPQAASFLAEFLPFILEEIFPASLEIGLDTTIPDEEKERMLEELGREKLGGFFGPDFVATAQAEVQARDALSGEVLAILANSDCYFGITPLPDEGGLVEIEG